MEIHLDPLGGIAGDMFAAALLDLRPDLEAGLREVLALCPLIEDVRFDLVAHNDGVLTGRQFLVGKHGIKALHVDDHHHRHDHKRHGESHKHHPHHHHHTHWNLIREALVTSRLDRETVGHAIGIFSCLAEAEGRVHGVAPDDVAFHEVGAWDSIADIVSAGWLITQLGAARWTVGPLPLGRGRVRTDHGPLPIPAPATAILLEGFTTIDDGVGGERVTPTGAAILSYLVERVASPSPMPRILRGSGYGFGTRTLPGVSNCLRALVFETAEVSQPHRSRIAVLECEIDDQTAEDLAQAIEALRAKKGVLDVIQAPVFGKKGRMMTHLRILAESEALDDVLALAFDETTTIGIRHTLVERSTLPRHATIVHADGKSLRMKLVDRQSGTTSKVEADDIADIAGSGRRTALRRLADAALETDRKDK